MFSRVPTHLVISRPMTMRPLTTNTSKVQPSPPAAGAVAAQPKEEGPKNRVYLYAAFAGAALIEGVSSLVMGYKAGYLDSTLDRLPGDPFSLKASRATQREQAALLSAQKDRQRLAKEQKITDHLRQREEGIARRKASAQLRRQKAAQRV
eukprot:TRINITY_DN4002_c0_g1_i1.p1 TRINITY_DN4002_c0_g1~~TRINITY_DN4002_c0_g1_i1.p1  ORF type:complete len:150 (+),score=24.64 TRINITY_DN4002_c0_g1_i1:14-463(+)